MTCKSREISYDVFLSHSAKDREIYVTRCEASNFEEPGAVIPHAGVCTGCALKRMKFSGLKWPP